MTYSKTSLTAALCVSCRKMGMGCGWLLEGDFGAGPSLKTTEPGESGFLQEEVSCVKITGHFRWMVGVGRESDRDFGLRSELQELCRGILLGARFVEAGRVELNGDITFDNGLDDRFVESTEIAFGTVGKLLDQVRVPQKIKEAGSGHRGIFLLVTRPDFLDVDFRPAAEPFRIVEIPTIAEVMNRPDEIVPIVERVEMGNPVFAVRKPVTL